MKKKTNNTFSIKTKYLSGSEIDSLKEQEANKDRSAVNRHAKKVFEKPAHEPAEKSASPVRAKKHLGQHFLRDEHIAKKIVDSLLEADNKTTAVEIGPGT